MLTIGLLAGFVAVFVAAITISEGVLERQRTYKMLREVRTIEIAPTDIRRREAKARTAPGSESSLPKSSSCGDVNG